MKFHHFTEDVSRIELPKQFTYPFHYVPHELCKIAAGEVEEYLKSRTDWHSELQLGKMFGVLVALDKVGNLGFLAAFSGNLAHSNSHDYFVPPVYDLLNPEGLFRIGEAEITAINRRIEELEKSDEIKIASENITKVKEASTAAIEQYRTFMVESKSKRDVSRQNGADESLLIAESQFQKAELKRIKQYWAKKISCAEDNLNNIKIVIDKLKTERKNKSAALQKWIFDQFTMHNALNATMTLSDIFVSTPQGVPPAGSGECAAPKLLQYAYINGYKPIAMAEFWWGYSPTDVIRHHGHFYGACKSKCEPILGFMLQGLDVEPNELEQTSLQKLDIVFHDEWLVIVNKPAGMLSVPGKINTDSVLERVRILYPEAQGPLIVHRLDMATSGLIIIALKKEVHKSLQAMFKSRKIKKCYIALLQGEVHTDNGSISLPLCAHPDDRPRQTVSEVHGKPSITDYQVLDRKNGITRIAFYPHTGRTHQLRVHAAHHLGLNAPIIGDRLYGHYDTRMYLHAESLQFEHPITHKLVSVEAKAPF